MDDLFDWRECDLLRSMWKCHQGMDGKQICPESRKRTNADGCEQKSVALLEATASPPKFASIDCETEQILCNSWSVGPPQIVHVLLPAPLADQSKPATTVRFIPLNQVNTTASDIVELHTKSKYLDTEPYEGIWHPFDGLFATTGANIPIAYAMWGFAKMPSWLPMIAISMLSRRFM